LYPICHRNENGGNIDKTRLSGCAGYKTKSLVRKFSLVAFYILGIIFPSFLYAIQTKKIDVTANQIFNATFTFNTGEFASRSSIHPDRVYFDASGSTKIFSPVPAYTSDFPAWPTNYGAGSWSAAQTSNSTVYYPAFQIAQIPSDTTSSFNPGSLILTRAAFVTATSKYNLELATYNDETTLVNSPFSGPDILKADISGKPHALVVTRSRIYIFYLGNDNKIKMLEHNGTTLASEISFTNTDTNSSFGLGGAKITKSGSEYATLVYGKSSTEINIVAFPDGNLAAAATTTVSVSNFTSNHADICQNPRTGIVYLTWLDGQTQYYIKSDTAGNFDFSSPAVAISGTWQGSRGMSIEGFNNFELDFALPSMANKINNLILKSSDSVLETFTENGNGQIFRFYSGSDQYAGLLTLSGFTFNFRKRLLEFPKTFSWQKVPKILHLQGPPTLNSVVSAEVDFAEITTGSCLAKTVNADGGRSPFIGQTNFVASSGNSISLIFDKDMNLNNSLVGDKVKMLAPDNSLIAITANTFLTRELRFDLAQDLDYSTTYRITVASDVLDANGSQIWSDYSLSFTTQSVSSSVLASEVNNISAYSAAGRTTADLISNGSEINATSTIYLRMKAIDPAFNTIDVSTVTVILNGSSIGQVSMIQTSINSTDFDGVYNLTAPHGGNNLYEFVTPASAIRTSVKVDFPTLSSVTPTDLSTGILINSQPQLVFSESLQPASVNSNSVRLNRGGSAAGYNLSLSGTTITIDPADSSEGYLLTDSTYEIAAGYGVKDLAGNPFVSTPATFTSSFTTQASQTRPLSVSGVKIFSDALFSSQLTEKADYAATGTIFLEFAGVDGANLTRDYAIASISNGNLVYLTETASASSVYRGSYSFANLPDRFNLIVQSVKSPAASASLLITYPSLSPNTPASASTNISVGSNIVVNADEAIDNTLINAANVKLMLGGSQISSALSYNAATRQITIDPDSPLTGQQTYQVQISNMKDLSGNPQLSPLIFNFTTEDNIPPTVTSFFPAQNQTGVTIEQILTVDFSENILPASISPATVKLTRGGSNANYNLSLSGNRLTIDPQDSSENFLLTATNYVLEIGPSVKDLAGNSLSNAPATFTLNFSTQPTITGPAAINSLTIYKDALYLEGWSKNENVPASATIYIKMAGTDGATQTRDIATVTMNLSWAGIQKISLNETASNSTGFYLGQFDLGSIPIFGFPNPLPPVSIGSLTFAAEMSPEQAATLSLRFPDILPSSTLVDSTAGQVAAANATNVRIDSSIITTFNDALLQAGNSTSFSVASGGNAIVGTRLLSADGTRITFVPASSLPFSSRITVSGGYSETGLKSKIGNPLYRSFSYSFTTQASKTQPLAINRLDLFKASDYSAVSAYESNSDFPGSGIVYVEIAGTDGSANTIDSTQALLSSGESLILNETSASSGVFRGQYSYSNLTDGTVLRISSALNSSASQTLVLSYPELSQSQPASGAAIISVLTNIFVKSNETLQPDLVNSTNVKLLKNGITEVSSNISWNSALSQIEIDPAATLDYSSNYLISVSGQKDLAGNHQKNQFFATFSTQATSVAPTVISGIKVFSDSSFNTQIADNALVAPSTQLYIEITATDQSTTTVDSTSIQMTSGLTAASSQLALIETGNNTGIFRGTIQLFNEENATVTVTSLTNPGIFSRVRTYGLPTITGIQPASGSASIFLDTRFTIKTSKAVDNNTLSTASIIISDSTGIASFLPTLVNSNEILIYSRLAKNSNVNLKISSLLKDSDGISFPLTIAEFKSVNGRIFSLRLYSDAGLTSQLADNSQVEANQTIWARIDATDSLNYSTEQQNLLVSLPNSTSTVALNESSPGIFTGSFVVPAAPNESLVMNPAENMAIASRLLILPDFAILSINPASGAVSVAADVWPSWYFSRPVNSADVTTANFKLIKVSDGSQVAGKISQSPTTRQIRFQPDTILQLLTEYELVADAGIRDENNNFLGTTLKTRFVSQPPPPPPTVISSFENFEADDYATPTRVVATNGALYIRMAATDVSFSTYEKARVRIDASDGSIDGQELVLIEVSPPSGVFTLALPINLKPGTVLTLQPQVAPAKVITVTAHPRTLLTAVDPASGSTELLLDTPITLRFSQPLLAASVASGVKIVAERDYEFTSTVDSTGQNLILAPTTGFATGAAHLVKIDTSLKDSNGLFLLPTNIGFSTIGENLAGFELYTGLPPRQGQPVSQTGEAVNGEISIVATTTNLFATLAEKRTLVIQAATQTFSLQLEESSIAGSFAGNFQPPSGIAQSGLVASLSFAGRPTMTFNLAPTPEILETFPASNALSIGEMPVISASFSRKMAFDAGQVVVDYPGGQLGTILQSTADSTVLSWHPAAPLPLQASCSIIFTGLIDYLGQPMPTRKISFSTGGLQGINLYRDDAFNLQIASTQIELPVAYAEIAASSPTALQGRTFNLMVRSGTRATATVSLPLIPSTTGSGRFRCRLDFEPVKNLPGYNVPLMPGEWLELSSPILTGDRKVYYYRFSGAASPIKIHQIRFFQEKDFAQELHGILPLATFYLQVEADDLNWFTTDVTMVKISSDADKAGFTMPLTEAGTHSQFFQGVAHIDVNSSNSALSRILAHPDHLIYVESVTDPGVSAYVRYLPEAGLRMVSAYPSPVRGNSMQFRFYLNFPGTVEIEIFDSAGDEVDNLIITGRTGENRREWRLPKWLANGVYFYVVKLTDSTAYPGKKRKFRGKFAVLR